MKHSTEILIQLYKNGDYEKLFLFDKQLQALGYLEDNHSTEIMYGGAARGGKSVLGCNWQIMRRISMPNSYGLIARSEYSKLEDTTLRTFFKQLNELGLERDVDYKAAGRPITIQFKNGSVVYFREIKYLPSDPEFDRLGSYDLTDAFLDESQQIHWKARHVLKGRFSETKGKNWSTIPKCLYTCNPKKNWIYTIFYKPYKSNTLDTEKKFILSLPSDNPHVPESYFENLRSADEITKQRLLHGNFEYDDDDSVLCDYDAIDDLFTNDHVQTGKKRISADLAMQGRDKFIAGLKNGGVITIICDMAKSSGKQIELELKNKKIELGVSNSNIVADSDGLGAYLESYIKNIKTFHGGSTKLNVENKKLYRNIKDACGFKLAEKINNRELYIKCTLSQKEEIKKEISMCLKRGNVDSDGKKELIQKAKMKELLGHSPDYLDMLLMFFFWDVTPQNKSGIV